MQWFKDNKGKAVLMVLAAFFMVPYFAFQNMKERKAKELAAETFRLDDKIDQVTVTVSRDGTFVVYQDGSRLPADGLGVAGVTAEDNKAQPERLRATGVKDEDFPVLAFFNPTGFDSTGTPCVVRRARDGHLLYPNAYAPPRRVRLAVPLRAGGFTVYFWETADDKGKFVAGEDDWFRHYMGVEPPTKLPPPEELDKLTDDQLKALGINRLSLEQYKLSQEKKTGVRGRVYRVGDPKNPLVPLQVPIHVYKDGTKFNTAKGQPKYDAKDDRIVLSLMSDAEGRYAADLPPGKYIVTVEVDGAVYGNALLPDAFPSVTVPQDGWADYDIRRSK